ncbi:MAG: PAS domain-containing protein [Halothiobacillus sp.]
MEKTLITDHERVLLRSEIISSRADYRGIITFVNPVFLKVTGYEKGEVLGQPHNMIRHPTVPRAVYRVMWDVIKAGEQFFGVTKNRCKNGDFYWTLGYFQPEIDAGTHEITGFRSTRHGLHDESLKQEFEELYQNVRQTELKYPHNAEQVQAGVECLTKQLKRRGFPDYQTFARRAL